VPEWGVVMSWRAMATIGHDKATLTTQLLKKTH
jgi:hypothetical protein